uniref:Uncharacterized protein n=1 Tax=Romanomermis culicivorax TaxID=13658 RepID=A0A915J732_ROMCU
MLSAPRMLRVLGPDVARRALEYIADRTIRTTPQPVANACQEPSPAANNTINVTEASPFPVATVPRSPKIGVLREVHPCGGLVIDFPGEELVSSDDDEVEE